MIASTLPGERPGSPPLTCGERIPIIGLGAGGHACVVIDILRQDGRFEVVALLDRDPRRWGEALEGVTILGGDDRLAALREHGVAHAFVGVGGIGSQEGRRLLVERAALAGYIVVQAVHPRAVVAATARLGEGTTVGANAIINPRAVVSAHVIVNTGAIVEHDAVVEPFAHLAPAAVVLGAAHVGAGAFVGAGAVVREGTSVGAGALVGAGAIVLTDIPPDTVAYGCPAKAIRPVGAGIPPSQPRPRAGR
ncbi:MAG: NeuD/PglB/VioB family sugar acetyltransferase [Candidatus Schekmanbacteria bacterium]|nr:NeuD/PglB/VioB family sugar acetyltransferase [Candidatus Schekmanbacteria bacterium]